MSGRLGLGRLTELEAAIVLYAATVVADGQVQPGEVEELVQQIRFVVGKSGNFEDTFEASLSDLLTHLDTPEAASSLKLNHEQLRFVAGLITSDELRVQVMNAVFEIAYSDDDYHANEREIVGILRDCWAV